MQPHTRLGIPTSNTIADISQQNYSSNEVKVTVTPNFAHDTLLSLDAATQQIRDSYIKDYRSYAHDSVQF